MKLAIVCAAGNLHRFGYQNVMGPCVDSWGFADRIYAVASDDKAVVPGAGMISGPQTWFEDGFDIFKLVDNMNRGLDRARKDGMDMVVCLDVNCYVPNGQAFRNYCEGLWKGKHQFGYTFRADQLGDTLFHCSGKRPRVFNLAYGWRVGCDKIVLDGNEVSYEIGDFSEYDDIAFMDCGLEMTVADMAAKMNYIRCYQELVPKRSKEFHWDYWFPYYVAKFRAKKIMGPVNSGYGRRVAEASQPNFASQIIMRAL